MPRRARRLASLAALLVTASVLAIGPPPKLPVVRSPLRSTQARRRVRSSGRTSPI